MADTSIEVVLEMSFLSLSNANIHFDAKELTWKTYTIVEAMLTSSRVELIDKHDFVKATRDENSETFVIYIAALEASESARMVIYLSQLGQVLTKAAQLAAL